MSIVLNIVVVVLVFVLAAFAIVFFFAQPIRVVVVGVVLVGFY